MTENNVPTYNYDTEHETHKRSEYASASKTEASDQERKAEQSQPRAGGICNPATATAVDSFIYYRSYIPFPKPNSHSDITRKEPSETESVPPMSADDLHLMGEDSSPGVLTTSADDLYLEEDASPSDAQVADLSFLSRLKNAPVSGKPTSRLKDTIDTQEYVTLSSMQLDAFNEIFELGYLFEERVRLRPIGYTPERGPFYMLSLTPGEVVTIRQKSFSKRTGTLTEEAEQEEEQKLDYSSTFTTELSEELSKSVSRSSNWGINASVGADIDVVTVGVGADFSGSNVEDVSAENSARRTEQIVRKVESMQKQRHKTVVSIAEETAFEEEAIRVLRNDEAVIMKLYFRRMMQVLHVSHERYGVRVCWAPCIKDPGKDVRELYYGTFDEDRIREKWENMPPDETVVGPQPLGHVIEVGTRQHNTTGMSLTSPVWGDSSLPAPVTIPPGEEFVDFDVKIDTTPKQKTKAVIIYRADDTHSTFGKDWPSDVPADWWLRGGNGFHFDVISQSHGGMELPAVGTTGIFQLHYRYFVGGDGLDQDTMTARFYVKTRPTAARLRAWEERKTAWRTEEANKEIGERRDQLKREAEDSSTDVWRRSELMRRVIHDYLDTLDEKLGVDWQECELVQILQRLFVWEEIQATLYPPWWTDASQTDSLRALQTNIFNASWAQVYIPIRQGYEGEALWLLLAAGAISGDIGAVVAQVDYHVGRMREHLLPRFERAFRPSSEDVQDVLRPNGIQLTPIDENQQWMNNFELEAGFQVLNRFVVTVPTDGVDIEACDASCGYGSEDRTPQQQLQEADVALREQIASHIGDGHVTLNIDL